MKTKVTIDGTNILSYLVKWNWTGHNMNKISECKIWVSKKIDEAVSMAPTLLVNVQRGETTGEEEWVFRGEIVTYEENGYSYVIHCKGRLYNAIKNEVHYSFDENIDPEGGQISELFKTLINDYTDLTCDNTTVTATGTGANEIIKQFVCRHADVYSKLSLLAELVTFQFYYNPTDDMVYFEPEGENETGDTLTVGTEIQNRPKWKRDTSDMINVITVLGATQNVETTEEGQLDVSGGWVSGDNGGITLSHKPLSVKVYADSSDPPTTLRKGGIPGATESYDYEPMYEQSKLVWNTAGGYAWPASDYVKVEYTHSIPVAVPEIDTVSVGEYGEFRRTLSPKNIVTVQDAANYAQMMIDKYKDPFLSTTIRVMKTTNYWPGDKFTIVDSKNNINEEIIATDITKKYPFEPDKIKVGTRPIKETDYIVSIAKKLQELEQALVGDVEFLYHNIISLHSITADRKSLTIETRPINDTFILGHPENGKLGGTAANKLGNQVGSWSVQYTKDY